MASVATLVSTVSEGPSVHCSLLCLIPNNSASDLLATVRTLKMG